MLSRDELQRIAGMCNVLRPDWNPKSVRTLIEVHLSHRTYRDLAVAFAYVATDANSRTPARILEAGPWWTAVGSTSAGQRYEAHELCEICSFPRRICELRNTNGSGDGHIFRPEVRHDHQLVDPESGEVLASPPPTDQLEQLRLELNTRRSA